MTNDKMGERLAEIEQRLKAITSSGWFFDSYNTIFDGNSRVISQIPDHPDGESSYEPCQIEERGAWYKESEANANLIANAPVYVAYLLEAVKDARRETYLDAAKIADAAGYSDENKDQWTITVTHTAMRIATSIRKRASEL